MSTGNQGAAIDLDSWNSSFREKMLEHSFVSELIQEAWFRHGRTIEILRAEVDSEGYDMVAEFDGVLRHIQLKATRAGAKTSKQNISVKLGFKPSGCVVWIIYERRLDAPRVDLSYRLFAGPPGQLLPDLGNIVAKHTKGDSKGVKKEKVGLRVVKKNKFSDPMDMRALFERLFVAAGPNTVLEPGTFGRARRG